MPPHGKNVEPTRFPHSFTRILTALFLTLLHAPALAATLCFEGELANELTFPFDITEKQGAAGGLALTIPEGAGTAEALGQPEGTATYRVRVPQDGTYLARLRVCWNGVCSNSVFLKVGEAKRRVVTDKIMGRWHWVNAGKWKLKAGLTEVQLLNREDGIWVDQLLFSTESPRLSENAQQSNLVPGGRSSKRPEARLILSCAPDDRRALPPPDFVRTHSGTGGVPLERTRKLVLRSRKPTSLVAWLRNNSLSQVDGEITLSTKAPVKIAPSAKQTFKIPRGTPLHKVAFQLSATAGMPRRTFPTYIRLRHPDGRIEGVRLLVSRPFQWLVTNAFPCPKQAGLDTSTPVEANLRRGFPGAAGGVRWRVASEDAITPFGLLDMRKAVGDKTYVMAYAYTNLVSPDTSEYYLDVQHDDMVRIWLNGRQVLSSSQCMPSCITRKLTKVTLKEGNNDLVVKLCQRTNYWEFGVQVLTLDGRHSRVRGGEVASLLQRKDDRR